MNLLQNFYSTPHALPPKNAKLYLSSGGGPFCYDIHYALEIDYIISKYSCDAIIETGTNAGDTTEYLAKQYPNLTIITCEIEEDYFLIAKDRLKIYPNVHIFNESSEKIVKKFKNEFKLPFYFLDAHGFDYWPLIDEIKNIKKGIVSVDDFDIGVDIFGYDQFEGKKCGVDIIPDECLSTPIYGNNPNPLIYSYPLPPTIQLAGRGFFGIGVKEDLIKYNKMFKKLK